MYKFHKKKFLNPISSSRNIFYSPLHKFDPTSNFGKRISKLYGNVFTKTKSNKILTPRKFPTKKNSIISIQEILRITALQKERENEKKRQNILYKNINQYSINNSSNYYKMIINNLLSDKPNKLKSHFTEVLNVIETKDLLTNYFLKKESRIKLKYLTNLFAQNIRIYPNYIKNEKIYNIMSNYLIEKEKLILRIEKNKKHILKKDILKYLNKDKRIEIKKEISSFTDSSNYNIKDNLSDLNSSFSYSCNNKNDTINKVKNIINDISILLKTNNDNANDNNYNNDDDNNNNEKVNVKIIENDKNNSNDNINFNKNDIKKNINTINKEILKDIQRQNKDNIIIKTKTYNNTLSFNENKIIKNIVSIKQNNLRLSFNHKINKNQSNINFNIHKNMSYKSEKTIKNNKNRIVSNKNKYPLSLFTDNNMNSNNINRKNFNTISNLVPINRDKKLVISATKQQKFKSTDIFLYHYHLFQNEKNQEKSQIKSSIFNVVKKYGISKNKMLNINHKININKKEQNNFCLTTSNNNNKNKNLFLKEKLMPDNNNDIKNKINLGIIQGKYFYENFSFFDKPDLFK